MYIAEEPSIEETMVNEVNAGETDVNAAEQAAISGNIQPETITGKLAKDITQQACARWHLKQAQWYEWQKHFGKPQKTEDGLILSAEQVAVFDCLRRHLDNGGTYASYREQLDREMVTKGEIVTVTEAEIAQECTEAEFTEEVERRGFNIPRSIQERAAIAKIAEYRMAAQLEEKDLDEDLRAAIAKEREASMGKFDKRRSPEQMEDAIAQMMSQFAA